MEEVALEGNSRYQAGTTIIPRLSNSYADVCENCHKAVHLPPVSRGADSDGVLDTQPGARQLALMTTVGFDRSDIRRPRTLLQYETELEVVKFVFGSRNLGCGPPT